MRGTALWATFWLILAGPAMAAWNWQNDGRHATASVCNYDGTCFGLQCSEANGGNVALFFQARQTAILPASEADFTLRLGNAAFASRMVGTGPDYTATRVYQTPAGQRAADAVLNSLRTGTYVLIDATGVTASAQFTLLGAAIAIDGLTQACQAMAVAAPAPPPAPSPPPAPAPAPPAAGDAALEILKLEVFARYQSECRPGSVLVLAPGAFRYVSNGVVEFDTRALRCDWRYAINPECGASRCTVYTYRRIGARYVESSISLR